MTDEIHKRGEELFQRLLDLPEADRQTFLEAHCEDAAVRAEVEELLEHSDQTVETPWPRA